MAKGTKICRVCGEEYEYCHTNRPANVFRYQKVACCAEHGAIYLQRIRDSRSQAVAEVAEEVTENAVIVAEESVAEEVTTTKAKRKSRKTKVVEEVTEESVTEAETEDIEV